MVKARAASQISGKLGLCTAPPTSVGGFFARMREMDVRAHEQRLTEKDPYTCLDFFATEKRESAERKYLGYALVWSGADRAPDAAAAPSGTPMHLIGTAVPPSCRAKRNM